MYSSFNETTNNPLGDYIMNTNYFDTRTQARNAVAKLNGKFKDFGADAPKGKRWAVISEALDVKLQEVQPEDIKGIPVPCQTHNHDVQKEITLLQASIAADNAKPRAVLTVQRTAKGGNVLNRFSRTHVQNLKGKTIPVYTKPNLAA